jgi:hypothetical protein
MKKHQLVARLQALTRRRRRPPTTPPKRYVTADVWFRRMSDQELAERPARDDAPPTPWLRKHAARRRSW